MRRFKTSSWSDSSTCRRRMYSTRRKPSFTSRESSIATVSVNRVISIPATTEMAMAVWRGRIPNRLRRLRPMRRPRMSPT